MDESAAAREALERLLLGGPRRWTRFQVAELTGMDPERTQRLWRAMGFPDAGNHEVAFTDADVHAAGFLGALHEAGFVDERTEASIARAMSQSLSRLADWQVDLFAELLAREDTGAGPAGADRTLEGIGRLIPFLRAVQDYVWRRHLVANADRLLGALPAGEPREMAVGFADLVGYTAHSQGIGGRELGAMIEDFESTTADVVARRAGRVVKTVGDGVLFTAGAASGAADIALDLLESWQLDHRPPLRVGAAYGPVLTHLGDVYSPVVNLASRLTSVAQPGTVLVDRELATRLRGLTGYWSRPLRRVSVRGYENLQPWLLRRHAPGTRRTRAPGGERAGEVR